MKYIKYFLLLFVVACSSPKIFYDYDTEANFNQYKTFDFFQDAGKELNEFDKKRIASSIVTNLLGKGIKRDAENPDFYVNFLTKSFKEESRNTVGIGVGGGGGNVGFGISGGIPIGGKQITQSLTIDFVTNKTDQLFWQSVSKTEINSEASPEEKTAFYQNLISKMIMGYPPKKTSK
ncbi:DUF4136 domain-containing protein [Tenacibaculum sp. UWU-22]|uniref:DUF4136 domain-containing protein n=1 Tax=Tenacibaculum sp. UWU-22 TaxID=3234187 RepID=UPI0034DB3572